VVPTNPAGRSPFSWEESGDGIGFVWDPAGYFGLILGIVDFFAFSIYHSVRNYRI